MENANRLETIETTDIQSLKWTLRKKEQRNVISAYIHDEQFERAAKLKNCGTKVVFAHDSRNIRRVVHANFCRDVLCPVCNWRKSIKVRENLEQIYSVLEGQGYYFLHLTLTIQNPEVINGSIDFLKNSFRRLSRSKWWKSKFDGYFNHIEITWSEKGGWHPHYHVLVATRIPCPLSEKQYYQWSDELSQLWQSITGNSFITKISKGDFNEVCKYVTKFSNFEGRCENIIALSREVAGRRLYSRGGVFRGVDIEPDTLTDDIDELDIVMYEYCKWDYKLGKYVSEFLTPEEFRKKQKIGGFGFASSG